MVPSQKENRAGSAMVESCLVMFLLCLILFGILQVSYLVMAKDVVSFAAFAGARAATVGMNEDFVGRVIRVASIPTAGPITRGSFSALEGRSPAELSKASFWDRAIREEPSSNQYWEEKHQIALYLGAEDESELDGILNYCNWLDMDTRIKFSTSPPGDEYAEVSVEQYVPLAFPFTQLFYRGHLGQMIRPGAGGTRRSVSVARLPLSNSVRMENHSSLYMIHE